MDTDDLDTYNSDTIHDMYVDSGYEINTNELPEVLDEGRLDDYMNNLNDWG